MRRFVAGPPLWQSGRAVFDSTAEEPRSGVRRAARRHVAVVIPARDEAATLGDVLDRLAPHGLGQIIVADNGSSDDTAGVARAHRADVASEPRAGYGAACAAGIAALAPDVEIVVFLDADLADDPGMLPALVTPIDAGDADLVIGVRPRELREAGAMTPPQAIGNRLATELIRVLWGRRYADLGPFRAIRRDALEGLRMADRRFGWTVEMQIRALQEGLRVVEVPVPYRRRPGGRSKISGSVRGVLRAGASILRTIGRLWWSGRRGARRGSEGRPATVGGRRGRPGRPPEVEA